MKGDEKLENMPGGRMEEVIKVFHRYRYLKIEKIFDGVSRGEFIALKLIDQMNGDKKNIAECIQAGDMCKAMKCTPAAISKMLKNLENKGWIVREVNKENRRVTNVCLTAKGHEVADYTHRRMHEFTERIAERLGEDRLDELISILEETYDISQEEIKKMEEEK